jgi:hypothetical protein
MRPGRPERREHEYVRHGTTLIANFNVATGQVLAPSLRPTRTEADFAAHIARTLADNLNTHQSEAWVRLVADRCDLAALEQRLRDFIAYCNQTAQPFKWTYRGRSLCI